MVDQNQNGSFYSGLSGLVLPIPKYKFPEEFQHSTRLTYYASLLNSIEINRSFYALPNAKTVAKWSHEVPENFKFTFKLWKQISHAKGLHFQDSDVDAFMQAINSVGEKKGSILIQFPASIKIQCTNQLEQLLQAITLNNPNKQWKLAIEFRDNSWYNEDTYDLVKNHGATVVLHDKSNSASPHLTADFEMIYVRFHGPNGDYRGEYTEEFLYEYAAYIREWISEGEPVFVYFNNTMGKAFDNLKTLSQYVRADR